MPVKKAPSDRRKTTKKAAAGPRATLSQGRVTHSEPLLVTDGASWGREAKEKRVQGRPVRVPSGKVCLAKMLDSMQAFLARGDVPNAMMPLMQQAATGKVESAESAMAEVLQSPEKLRDMFDLIDMVVIECVLQPTVHPLPQDDEGNVIPPHLRDDDDKLYIDYVDPDDKMFLFNYALSGVSDIEQFRAQSDQIVVPLHSVEGVEQSAKRHPANHQ